MYSSFADEGLTPPSFCPDDSGKFSLEFKSSIELEALHKEKPKSSLLKGLSSTSSVESDKKVLDFLNSPALPNDCHIIKNDHDKPIQFGLTVPLTKEDIQKDCTLRSDAALLVQGLGCLKELDKAIDTLPNLNEDKFGMLSGLKGFSQLAINSLSPVTHKAMALALDNRKSLRTKASINIAEPELKSSLVEGDPWSTSLYPSDSTKVLLESKKVPALRAINVKQASKKSINHQKPMNKVLAGKLLKAKQASNSHKSLKTYHHNRRPYYDLPYNKRNNYNRSYYNPAPKVQGNPPPASAQGIIRPRDAPEESKANQQAAPSVKEEVPPSKLFRGTRGRGRGYFRGNRGGSRQ